MQHSLTPTPPYAFSLRCELGTRHNSKYSKKKFFNEIYFVSRLASTLKRCLYLSAVGLSNVGLCVCIQIVL